MFEIANALEYWMQDNPMMGPGSCQLFPVGMTPADLILTIMSIFILVSWILSIIFILWWGLLLILSGWKDDKIKPAINTIRYAVIWIIVTVLSIFIFPILGGLLGIDTDTYASPWAIIDKSKEIWQCIFKQTNDQYWTWWGWTNNMEADFSDI